MTLKEKLDLITEHYDGKVWAAQFALDVGRSTWYRWRSTGKISRRYLKDVNKAVRKIQEGKKGE